jgi:hypothetical protein
MSDRHVKVNGLIESDKEPFHIGSFGGDFGRLDLAHLLLAVKQATFYEHLINE